MPLTFKTGDEMRDRMAGEGRKWRNALKKAKEADAKSGVALVADTVVGALDEVAGCVNYISHNQDKAKKRVDHLEEGVDIAVRNAEKSLTDHTSLRDDLAACRKKLEKLEKVERKIKSNTTAIQRGDLDRSSTVVICRNIKPVTSQRESYADLERAFMAQMKPLKLDKVIHIDYVKRLMKSRSDTSGASPLLRVTLASVGEKRKLYEAVSTYVRAGNQYEPSFHNEIPGYALGAQRHLNKLAAFMRNKDESVKTRVSILKGDVWPSISVRDPADGSFKKMPDEEVEKARKLFLEDQRRKAEDKLLNSDEMETEGASASTSGRGGRQSRTSAKTHK